MVVYGDGCVIMNEASGRKPSALSTSLSRIKGRGWTKRAEALGKRGCPISLYTVTSTRCVTAPVRPRNPHTPVPASQVRATLRARVHQHGGQAVGMLAAAVRSLSPALTGIYEALLALLIVWNTPGPSSEGLATNGPRDLRLLFWNGRLKNDRRRIWKVQLKR